MDLLSRDSASAVGGGGNSRTQPSLDPNVQHHLSNFSLITHSFGTPAIVAALGAFQAYLSETIKCIDKLQQQQQQTTTHTMKTDVKNGSESDDVMGHD